jgi:hypothetical protein
MDSARSIVRQLAPYIYIALLIAAVVLIKHYSGKDGGESALQLGEPILVIDGDSLRSGDSEFRLFGIDAPEYSQTCSEQVGRLGIVAKLPGRDLRLSLRATNSPVCLAPTTGSVVS